MSTQTLRLDFEAAAIARQNEHGDVSHLCLARIARSDRFAVLDGRHVTAVSEKEAAAFLRDNADNVSAAVYGSFV